MTPALLAAALAGIGAALTLPWSLPATAQRLRALTTPVGPAERSPGPALAPVGAAVLLDLVATAVAAGASVPRAVAAVGEAVGGPAGAELRRAATALELGAPWGAAWHGTGRDVGLIRDALGPTWTSGAAPGPALRVSAEHERRERRRRAQVAAGRLAVQVVLPLGLFYLPAFVLIGLVPVLLSLVGHLLSGA